MHEELVSHAAERRQMAKRKNAAVICASESIDLVRE
jgi:hypothetical protein